MPSIFDLVVLGLVVLILAIYRQLDSKNRSLEKVKRLGDKLIADLDAVAQEKASQLKDIAIEADVHQQASKKAMERLQGAEDGLNARSAQIEEMQVRIDGYDTALRELITMTQKAEENISRLRDESAYIDKVGRRIRQAAGQLQQLQDRLPGMLSEFKAQNEQSLAQSSDGLVASVQSRLDILQGQLDMSNQGAAEMIQRMRGEVDEMEHDIASRADAYRRAFAEIESEYHNRLEEVARKGLALETESLATLNAEMQRRIDEKGREIRAFLENSQAAVQNQVDSLKQNMGRVGDELGSWEQEMGERIVRVQEEFDHRVAAQDEQLESGLQKLSTFIQEARGEILDDLKLTQDSAAERVAELQEAFGLMVATAKSDIEREVDAARTEIHEWQTDVQQDNKQVEQELSRIFDDSRSRLEQQVRSLNEVVEQTRADMEKQVEQAGGANTRLLDDFQAGMQNQVERLDGSIYQVEKDLEVKLSEAMERGKTLADVLLTRINQDVDNKTESMREAINQRVEQVNSSVKASHDQIDESFNELRGRVDGWIEASRAYMTKLEEQVNALSESSRQSNLEHKRTIESHISETQGRLNSYEQGLSTRVAELETFITRAEDMVQDQFVRLHEKAETLARESGAGLDEKYEAGRVELLGVANAHFDALREDIERGRGGLQAMLEAVRSELRGLGEEVDHDLEQFRERTLEREAAAVQGVDAKIQSLGAELTERSNGVRDQVQQILDRQADEVRELFGAASNELEKAKSVQEQVEAQNRDIAAVMEQFQAEAKKRVDLFATQNAQAFHEFREKTKASIAEAQADMVSQLDTHAKETSGRIQEAGADLTDRARQVQGELEHWREGLQSQIEELRGLAQGLHQDTLGSVQKSIGDVQRQAEELYERIRVEVTESMAAHEAQIMELVRSNESDIRHLQTLTGETQVRIASWQEQLGKTESEIARDVQEVRENARSIAQKSTDDMRETLEKRQNELAQSLVESMAKLKSDIAHSRGDIEQDVVYLQQQIDQWKSTFQDHLKTLQENSKNIEDQALAGLKDRIEELREEARVLTRKAQDEFSASIGQHQAQIQAQMELYQNDLKRVQGLNKEIQNQTAQVEADIAKSRAQTKDEISSVQDDARKLAVTLRESVQKEIEERHRALLAQVKQVIDQMSGEVSGSKTNIERELSLIQQQLEQSKVEYAERIKALQQDGANLRREAMAGFQERVDALRDEARKLTGNVKIEVAQVLSEHQREVEQQLKQAEDEYHRMQDLSATSQVRFQEIQEIFNKTETMAQKEFENLRDKTREMADSARSQVAVELQRHREEALSLVRQNLDAFQQDLNQTKKSLQGDVQGLTTEFEHYSGDLRERFEALGKQGLAMQDQVVKSFQGDLEKVDAQTAAILKTMQEQAGKALEQQRQQIAGLFEQSNQELGKVRGTQSEIQSVLGAVQENLARESSLLDSEIVRVASEMAERIQRTSEAHQQAVLVDVEKRLKDYEKEVGYRIEKIETVNDDIDNLESNLRQSMERLTVKLREDLDLVGQELHKRREEDMNLARKDLDGLKLQMVATERGLDELKQRAYDNVNEKLKVFEDEFFVDLKQRSDKMDSRIEEWKNGVQTALAALEMGTQAERKNLEDRYTAALREKLTELSDKFASQFATVETGFRDFESSLGERMGAAEKNLREVETGIASDVKALQAQTIESVQREFVRMNQDLEGRIRGFEKEIESRLQKSDVEIKSKAGDLQAMLESSRSDMTIWQNQVLQQMRSAESGLQQDLSVLKGRANQTISELKDDFVRQRDEAIAQGAEERAALKADMQAMEERLSRLQADLEYKSKEAMELFERDYQSFQSDVQRHNRDLQDEVDERVKDFRSFVSDSRDEFEVMQRRLFGKLDEDAKSIDLSLREMDKRMKAFVSQTKLFERADSLQDSLSSKIETMKQDLQNLEEQRKTVLDLDPYLARVRKLAEEVNEKVGKLTAEKKRLDGLDEDYKKLINISNVVDQKLAQVTASNDTLTNIQLSLRHLEDVQKDVESKFDRLERKSEILDATTDGIEKNFQYLQDVDARMNEVKSALQVLPQQVQDLGQRVATLTTHKKEADTALKNVTNLDKILKDVEARVAELNKARDWIARTETRFGEITREAEEKVNILQTLAKSDSQGPDRGSGPSSGGPSASVREVVLKLAQQGWRVEEIARSTKLSRGEVELILEMNSRA